MYHTRHGGVGAGEGDWAADCQLDGRQAVALADEPRHNARPDGEGEAQAGGQERGRVEVLPDDEARRQHLPGEMK